MWVMGILLGFPYVSSGSFGLGGGLRTAPSSRLPDAALRSWTTSRVPAWNGAGRVSSLRLTPAIRDRTDLRSWSRGRRGGTGLEVPRFGLRASGFGLRVDGDRCEPEEIEGLGFRLQNPVLPLYFLKTSLDLILDRSQSTLCDFRASGASRLLPSFRVRVYRRWAAWSGV